MKILLVHRYFWPDSPPYASMLRTIAEHLVEEGHDVDVLTAQPSYGDSALHDRQPRKETLNGVKVIRLPLLAESKEHPVRRATNLALFASQVFAHITRRRTYDVVMAATTPPVLVALAARIGSRLSGARFVYHMQDIYPEVLAANSGRPLKGLMKVLQRVDATNTRKADRVVVLSTDMRAALEARGHDVNHVRMINNFVPDKSHTVEEESADAYDSVKPSSFQVIFAGNLGNFQGLDVVIDAFALLSESKVNAHLLLLGDGAAEASLRQRAVQLLDKTVFFRGRTSQARAEAAIAGSDLALVTLNPGVIQTAFPSKTMTYLASGTKVLAAVEETSELGELLESNGVGATADLTPEAIAAAITEAVDSHKPSVNAEGIKRIALEYASTTARLPQWSALLEELDSHSF